jgi:DNA-binding Xre family transcriptional regulator
VNYDKLWHILIDKKMSKKDLRLKAGVSTAVIAKLSKEASLTTGVLGKIYDALNCNITDIMELERSEQTDEGGTLRGYEKAGAHNVACRCD